MRRIRLVAHNVRSLWNVGAFFRSADAFAIERVYLSGYTGCPPRKEISKTAIGADAWIEWEHVEDPLMLLAQLRSDGWQIVALETGKKSIPLSSFEPQERVCIIVGHELSGIPQHIQAVCDSVVTIPMLGKKESLNVAVAASIALFYLRAAGTREAESKNR